MDQLESSPTSEMGRSSGRYKLLYNWSYHSQLTKFFIPFMIMFNSFCHINLVVVMKMKLLISLTYRGVPFRHMGLDTDDACM